MAGPTTTGSLATTGSVTLSGLNNQTLTQFQISGTYGTVTFVFEGSIDGTNFFPVYAMIVGTAVNATGTISPTDNTTVLYNIPSAGLASVRLRATAVGSGTLAVAAQSGSWVGLPSMGNTWSGALFGATTFSGAVTLSDVDIVLGTTTGTKIGTATTQKLGFFNATPIVQPVASTDTTTSAAGSGTAAYLNTSWAGASGSAAYTVGGLVTRLKALGLIAA